MALHSPIQGEDEMLPEEYIKEDNDFEGNVYRQPHASPTQQYEYELQDGHYFREEASGEDEGNVFNRLYLDSQV